MKGEVVYSEEVRKAFELIRDSIVDSIPACHAGDPGSIPGRGAFFALITLLLITYYITDFNNNTCNGRSQEKYKDEYH